MPCSRSIVPRHVIALCFGALVATPRASAETAIDIAPGAPSNVFAAAGTTHGWQFTVNAMVEVTHLGLYDRFQNGFAIAHPVGLWDGEGELLASVVLSAGTGDQLFDGFRYVSIEDSTFGEAVVLTPDTSYTIGFYSASFNQLDGMVIFDGFHTVNPLIDYAGFGVGDFTDGLEMPSTNDGTGTHRFGPNLQFTIVPGPPVAMLLLACALRGTRRRPV